ncbi:MAG: hypothetical protein QM751_12725 [Paludibacteraceae bacterium]
MNKTNAIFSFSYIVSKNSNSSLFENCSIVLIMSEESQIIYILCVANLRSGGPEALHQLCYYMRRVGLDAYMVYYNTTDGIEPMPPVYSIYKVKNKLFSEIEDSSG